MEPPNLRVRLIPCLSFVCRCADFKLTVLGVFGSRNQIRSLTQFLSSIPIFKLAARGASAAIELGTAHAPHGSKRGKRWLAGWRMLSRYSEAMFIKVNTFFASSFCPAGAIGLLHQNP